MTLPRLMLLIPTLDQSGAEKQLALLAAGIPKSDFETQVVTLTRGGHYATVLEKAGIPVINLGKRWKLDPWVMWKLRSIISEFQPDILHTWLFAANAYGRLLTGKHQRTHVVVSERCVDSWKQGWQHWLDRKLIGRTTRMVGNSQSVVDFYREQGFPAERLRMIPNGIDVPHEPLPLRSDDPQRVAFRAKLFDIPADAKVIGYVGRLARQKRIEDLIWATELMQNLRDDVWLVIAGEGPERERAESFARDIRLDRVRFLGHVEQVPDLLSCLDVFWLGSDFEGQSNSLMEAMAAGLPVVASEIAPNRELVEHQKTGILVPVGDRAAFARETNFLLRDPELSRRLGTAAHAKMKSDFTVERMIASYVQLYHECLETQP